MNIIPAIDLQDGKCVRLFKGDFDRVTPYSDDPLGVASAYESLAVNDLHIVDLDGARSGTQANANVVREICSEARLKVQLGGGIRDHNTVRFWLEHGVTRCVIGSLALTEPEVIYEIVNEHGPDRVVLALDVGFEDHTPVVVTHGWARSSGESLWDCIERFVEVGAIHILCTDISRDGAMIGPNLDLYETLIHRFPALTIQASGGIRDIADIQALAERGVPAAITGKALLEGAIQASEVESFRRSA